MPLKRCQRNNEPGWKWGDEGYCYTYDPDDEESENEAKQKALNQGIAAGEIEPDSVGGDSNTLKRVQRFEEAEILDYTEDEEDGFLTVELAATRTGVMPYYDWEKDEVVYELKHPDEIFSENTMDSLKGVPITDGHPPVMVNSKNWLEFTKGTTHQDVRKEDNLLVVSETLFDDDIIAYVKSGKKAQASIGFRADLEETSGEFEGQEYDRIQRNIKVNHVGHVEQGRAGEEVKARIDSKDGRIGYMNMKNNKKEEDEAMGDVTMENLVNYEFESGSGFEEFDSGIWIEEDKKDDFEGVLDSVTIDDNKEVELEEVEIGDETIQVAKEDAEKLKNKLDSMEGKLDSKEDEVKQLEGRVDELEDRDMEAVVQERLDLIDTAREYVDGFEATGKKARDIKVEVIQKLDEDFDPEEKSDEYVDARFDGAIQALDKIKSTSRGDNNLYTKRKKKDEDDELNKKREARKNLKK